jgi:hypothetical protein
MDISRYLKEIDNIQNSDLLCRCCGAKVAVLSNASESICNFCEAFVTYDHANVVHGSREIEKNLLGMQNAVADGKWEEGVQYADALAATKEPHFLFGASAFYRYFSDSIYNGIDYSLPGFMYSNSEKRSDESNKNKFNAMANISKSKEFLFKAIKIMNGTASQDPEIIFLHFMSEIKLKRNVLSKKLLNDIKGSKTPDQIKSYSEMVYGVATGDRQSEKYISDSISKGVANSIYYLSKYLASNKREIEASIILLTEFVKKTNMPMAYFDIISLKAVGNASYLEVY